jgi:hypothetical protein
VPSRQSVSRNAPSAGVAFHALAPAARERGRARPAPSAAVALREAAEPGVAAQPLARRMRLAPASHYVRLLVLEALAHERFAARERDSRPGPLTPPPGAVVNSPLVVH